MTEFSLLREYLWKYRRYFAAGLAALIAVDLLQIAVPWIIRDAIDFLASATAPAPSRMITYGAAILGISLGVGVTRFIWRYCIIGISRKIEEDLRNRFYRHLLRLDFRYFDHTPVGDLMAYATNDIEAIRMMCGMALVAATDSLLLMTASLFMMLTLNASLTAYILIPLPIVTLTTLKLGPHLHARFKKVQERFSDLTQYAQETFTGVKVIKSFVQEKPRGDDFAALNRDYIRDNLRLVKIWGMLHPIIWVVSGLCSVIILLVGGTRVIDGRMSMGDFVAFNSYLGILVWPMIAVGWVVNLYQRGKASLGRLKLVFDESPGIQSPPDAVRRVIEGRIQMRGLSFAFREGSPVLHGIDLEIAPGEWIAVMGRTGTSKTALVSMLPRLYDPPPGTVFIDGIDVHSYDLESLRSQIACVPQQTFLFSDTIANNIRFGSDISDETLAHCIESANLTAELDLFPDGADTIVGERVVTLSGGQKQRVAIARALAAHSPIMILDDALSAVDTETEEKIIGALRSDLRGVTVLLITHRVSAARRADRIVYLDEGRIAETGTHSELLDLGGHYWRIYEQQRLLEEIDMNGASVQTGRGDLT